MLRLQNIKKDYKIAAGSVHALKGVSLSFRSNEFVCILGQSGCGKTTLLNIIGGLDQYTSGDLIIQGKSTKDFKDRDWDVYRNHRIGFIFQSYNLIPHQTVLGNVELALTIAGVGREERRERAKKALERVGLGNELEKRPNQLSGGQCQRVAIARALVNEPDILLADEPTGALDSATSVQIMELIKEIAGERLVIMVTHNPDLAQQYASRIVRLSDGLVESDSNPYTKEEEAAERVEKKPEAPKKIRKKEQARARMGFLTSLALSGRNLLTKKGRTVLTSVAGSIGIISVCLVLALSSGFNGYIKRTEEDMLSYYPVQITESTYDITSIMASFSVGSTLPDLSELENKVYVDSFLTGIANGMTVKNDISEEYIAYLEDMNPEWYSAIQYSYGASLTENLFTCVETGTKAGETTTQYMSLSSLKEFYIVELETNAPQYSTLVPFANFFGNIVNKMPGSSDLSDASYGKYVQSQYDVVAGRFPQSPNEAVLVIGGGNEVTDLTLAQLGLLDEPTFLSLFQMGQEENDSDEDEYLTLSFDEILGKQYVLYFNDAVYAPNDQYPFGAQYPYSYSGRRESLTVGEGEGISVTVSGILRLKEDMTYGCLSSGLNLTEAVVNEYIAENMQSEIVRYMLDNSRTATTDQGTYTVYLNPPAANLAVYYTSSLEVPVNGTTTVVSCTYEDTALRHVGGVDAPNAISIYATDFDGKDDLLAYLDAWNENRDEQAQVTYTDTVGLLMGMVQTMLNVITYVLVAFTAISLVVSSVMIGIITYVSVVERVKEIGVLRSLGARKQDIKNLFNAETFIIGLAAGLIGVMVTFLIEIPVNAIIYSLSGIGGIASLSVLTAFIMVVISVILTLISGLIPASAAAKKDPVIALRTE